MLSYWALDVDVASAQTVLRDRSISEAIANKSRDSSSSIADSTIHGCAMVSIDRGYAVGDRGLILTTEDGGKTWRIASSMPGIVLHAVGFEPEEHSPGISIGGRRQESFAEGLVVGGSIDPYSGHSEGVVLRTSDEGKTWNKVALVGIPRLTGLQRLGAKHWLAWGDWSSHWQTALFETIDGGISWSPRPIPCGHLQAAAIDDAGRAMVVDRSGKVQFSKDGVEFEDVLVPSDPFRPWRFCRWTSGSWWLGGDAGKILRSDDGVRWEQLRLPGTTGDQELISLRDLSTAGSHVWVLGSPGTVIWHSADNGVHWEVQETKQTSQLQCISALSEQVVMICGELGKVLITRNSGQAWLASHRSGVRDGCFAISSTERTIPWDLMTYIAFEGKRHVSGVVVHDQHFEQKLTHYPERSVRIESMASPMHLNRIHVFPDFPTGDLRSGLRATDLAYYQKPNSPGTAAIATANPSFATSELVRKLILEIRQRRPDVIVTEDVHSTNPLESANAAAAAEAIQLASLPNFKLFSDSSRIPLPEWTAQRVLHRSVHGGGIHLAPTMTMNGCGLLLAEAMLPVRELTNSDPYFESIRHNSVKQKTTYRMLTQRSVNIVHPLDGLILDDETLLREPKRIAVKLPNLLASASANGKIPELLKSRGNGLLVEFGWDESLREFIKPLSSEMTADSLWTIAVESRRSGHWNRWSTAIQLLFELFPEKEIAEVAYHEWLTHFGSAEVHFLVRQQLAAVESKTSSPTSVSGESASGQLSPFATNETSIAKVGYEKTNRLTQIAKGESTLEFSQKLANWGDAWQARKSEPKWAWLITSRYRTSRLHKGVTQNGGEAAESKEAFFWPPASPQLRDWNHLLEQEKRIVEGGIDYLKTIQIPWANERPYLDGKADETIWRLASPKRLMTAWESNAASTEVRWMRDSEFLFLHCICPINVSNELSVSPTGTGKAAKKIRTRDGLNETLDHVRLRIDLDRDYATWFEVGWDRDGGTLDQCNDMRGWNPNWFIALDVQNDTWSAEIAIPLDQIMERSYPAERKVKENKVAESNSASMNLHEVQTAGNAVSPIRSEPIDWSERAWAISITRERPSESTEFLVAGDSDAWSPDQWLLVYPGMGSENAITNARQDLDTSPSRETIRR
ncbi:MAG: YCF48-related protein [Pirellula sp.]